MPGGQQCPLLVAKRPVAQGVAVVVGGVEIQLEHIAGALAAVPALGDLLG